MAESSKRETEKELQTTKAKLKKVEDDSWVNLLQCGSAPDDPERAYQQLRQRRNGVWQHLG
eukprot:2904139-Alexandrium_andersonii.AAC.1